MTRFERATELGTVLRAYDQLLADAFPDSELLSRDDFAQAWERGELDVECAQDDEGIVATAVGEPVPGTDVMLLAWLTTHPARRGQGLGNLLVRHVLDRWASQGCRLVLAEVEHPSLAPANPLHGDPRARLAFYARLGARVLPIPYFQPRIDSGHFPVFGLMLLVLFPAWEAKVPGELVRAYLQHAFADEPRSAALVALMDASAGDQLDTVSTDVPDQVLPRSGPDGLTPPTGR